MKKYITHQYRLVLAVSALLTLLYNRVFFAKLIAAFPIDQGNTGFIIAAAVLLFLANVLFFALFAGRYVTKPLLIFSVIAAAGCSYFMSTYGVVIDDTMLQNVIETDIGEASGLINTSMILQMVGFGLLPAVLIWRLKLDYAPLKKEILSKAIILASTLAFAGITLFSFSANFASFFREYKPVRYYIAPLYAFYSGIQYAAASPASSLKDEPAKPVSKDAEIVEPHDDKALQIPERELIFLVVGESARADHFQLNGYARETNPALSKVDNLISFTNFKSCGTTTSVSVPCMFSMSPRKNYENGDIYEYENVLDVLQRNDVNIAWLDNNSSSKGVAERVDYIDFRHNLRPECEEECHDEVMLQEVQTYIDSHTAGDILIVMHQMGSHGPEYYKRYPAEFEYFKPVCKTNKLGDCTEEEITNAYDNTIRYTDHFLAQTIALIKKNDNNFETGLLYISDHGESLGESGIYLHGMPYAIAPDAQKHIGVILWGGKYFDFPIKNVTLAKDKEHTQDQIYCTLLSLFEVKTEDCTGGMTILTQDMARHEDEEHSKDQRPE